MLISHGFRTQRTFPSRTFVETSTQADPFPGELAWISANFPNGCGQSDRASDRSETLL